MPKLKDLTGIEFERLKVTKRAEDYISKQGVHCVSWECVCRCGTIKNIRGSYLTSGHTKSCGCLSVEMTNNRNRTHGLRNHPLYRVWYSIKARCYNPKRERFKDWGGRGITMCEEWRNNFKAFYDWAMANGYKEGLQIDREDNDGNYTPENCRFVTAKVNSNNRRTPITNTSGTEYLQIYNGARGTKYRVVTHHKYIGSYKTKAEALMVIENLTRGNK